MLHILEKLGLVEVHFRKTADFAQRVLRVMVMQTIYTDVGT